MSAILKQWFDELERALTQEAQAVGLLSQSSLVGAAREFFVKRVLASVLPPSVHIGTGQIVGSDDTLRSKQIDIIIYDPRYPLLESHDGIGLYFVEGVIAAIEVKSTLTKTHLRAALDNAVSAMEIRGHVESVDDLNRRAQRLMATGLPAPEAQEAVKWALTPWTYVFAFNTSMKPHTVSKAVDNWYTGRGQSEHPRCPHLPRVIAAPKVVALQHDGWVKIDPGDDVTRRIETKHGPRARCVMGVWPSAHHFGWIALHLMHAVHDRLGCLHFAEQVRRPLDQYLRPTATAYFEESMKGKRAHYIVWTGRKQTP
jgi:hypothetical protein